MNIIMVTTELPGLGTISGGLGTFTANLSSELVNKGHKVTVLLSTVKEDFTLFIDDRIEVIKLHVPYKTWERFDKISKLLGRGNTTKRNHIRYCLSNAYRSFQIQRNINHLYKIDRVDLVHYCNLDNLSLFHNKNIPYLIRLSSYNYETGKYRTEDICDELIGSEYLYREKLQDMLLKKTRHIISPSFNIAIALEKRLNVKVDIIETPFVFDTKGWDYDLYNSLEGDKYILFFGRLSHIKGVRVLVEIMKKVLEIYPEYKFVIAGKDDPKDLLNGSEKPSVWMKEELCQFGDRFIYLGGVEHNKLYPIIANADMCLLPYRYENLSNACIEAMALGTIVVGTDGASFEQLIEDGVSGFLCERDNADSFVNGVKKVINLDEENRHKMVEASKKNISRLSPDVITNKFIEKYNEIIRGWEGGL